MPVSRTLADGVLAGDPRSLARAISLIEDEAPQSIELVRRIHAATGRAYIIGVTGPPGAGKSTLVDRLVAEIRAGGQTVGVVAIDPSSPFTGGAVLGDRVRMTGHAGDPGVFIRSMATRGHLGGLSRATGDATLVLDAAGKAVVVVETVGVGQDEVDIVRMADVSIVTLVPGTGDEVQALKAGIMEIADIFVINKADREGADRLVHAVETSLSLQPASPGVWRPPVLKTTASQGEGIAALWNAIGQFRAQSSDERMDRQRAREEHRLRELLVRRFLQRVDHVITPADWTAVVGDVITRRIDPYTAAERIVSRIGTWADAAGETS